jgi:NMD protein affecting ribosome stability and mRNA decay
MRVHHVGALLVTDATHLIARYEMKNERRVFRNKELILVELSQDSYKSKDKLPEPTRCPACGATYHHGRWTWDTAPAGAHETMCPACHRIHDKFPAGYVTLKGEFLTLHREEILKIVRNCETKEKTEHPLERIMAIEDIDDSVLVTTTGTHLARDIAGRLHSAYKGTLDLHYAKGENLLRATWSR